MALNSYIVPSLKLQMYICNQMMHLFLVDIFFMPQDNIIIVVVISFHVQLLFLTVCITNIH